VHGEPAPQGSKRAQRSSSGASFMREDNPRTEPWRQAVAAAAAQAFNGGQLLTGPLRLELRLNFARPRSHYRTGRYAGELKDSAPVYCERRPDLDKLVRAIGDALTGVVVVDDAAFVELDAVKLYGQPGAEVTIRRAAW
jgi:Holliday junction resolvase RusA-like endonuclease